MYLLKDYQYELLDGYIAQTPASPADSSKLLVPSWTSIHDYRFYDLPKLLTKRDVLFFNDTKVIKARVPLKDIFVEIPHHTSANRVVDAGEIFFLELHNAYKFEWLISLTKRVRRWTILHFNKRIRFIVENLTEKWVLFQIDGMDVLSFFEKYGQMPLPPYITHTTQKEEHYQPIFAQHAGSVAAPTASLHFTPRVLEALRDKNISSYYLTLHVGLGTFKPVDTDDIRSYEIHEETIIVDENIFEIIADQKAQGKNIIAVWTTVARTLETLPYLYKKLTGAAMQKHVPYRQKLTEDMTEQQSSKYIMSRQKEWTRIICHTRIFIYPWFERKIVDGLITNFHLPWSTLLMLVASFIGYDTIMKIYQHAIQQHYRFFSFGDAMLLRKN